MRFVLALGLLITLSASANAATVHRSKTPEGHLRPSQRVTVPRATLFPVGPTNRPGTGWIAPQGQKIDATEGGQAGFSSQLNWRPLCQPRLHDRPRRLPFLLHAGRA